MVVGASVVGGCVVGSAVVVTGITGRNPAPLNCSSLCFISKRKKLLSHIVRDELYINLLSMQAAAAPLKGSHQKVGRRV